MSEYKIVRFYETGGPEVLKLEMAKLREPDIGEVAVKVLAIGITQGDAMYRSGTYLEMPALPSGLGTEICAEIIALGENTENWSIGDRVCTISSMSINRYPLYGEYAILPQTSLVKTPTELSDIEGAGFSLAYISMYFALIKEARLRVGEWVLLNAAAATTSLAACQIAKLSGARVIGVVRNRKKIRQLEEFEFDHVLEWNDELVNNVKDITGSGVDIILDPVLGNNTEKLSEMASWRARIIHYGALDSAIAKHSLYQLAPKFLTIKGFTIYGYSGSQVMGMHRNDAAMNEAAEFLDYGVSVGALKPNICKVLPIENIVQAHEELSNGNHIGKIVVTT